MWINNYNTYSAKLERLKIWLELLFELATVHYAVTTTSLLQILHFTGLTFLDVHWPMWYRGDDFSIQETRADNSIYRIFRTIKSSKIFVKQGKHKSFSAVHLNFSNVYSILGHYKMLIANSFNPNFAHWHKTL